MSRKEERTEGLGYISLFWVFSNSANVEVIDEDQRGALTAVVSTVWVRPAWTSTDVVLHPSLFELPASLSKLRRTRWRIEKVHYA